MGCINVHILTHIILFYCCENGFSYLSIVGYV